MATSIPRKRLRRDPMSRVDTAWLRMEQPTNPMMITGVLMLAQPLSLARLKQVVDRRFLSYGRFRQKPVDTATGTDWLQDEDFDLDWHVRESALPGHDGKRMDGRVGADGAASLAEKRLLEQFVSRLASSPLNPGRPLWQFDLVERYGAGSAVVVRIHHCYADGIALVQVLLSMTDTVASPAKGGDLSLALLKPDGAQPGKPIGAVDRYMHLGGMMVEKGMEIYRDPSLAALLAREGGEIACELVNALVLSDDPPSLLRGPLGVSKRVAWAKPLDLDEVKAVGRACGCTVNDVLMATAAGALRHYMLERGEFVDGITVRATVPVNLRPLKHDRKLGNYFGLVFLELPVGEGNPIARVERVARCMNDLKESRQAIVTFGILSALGMAPTALLGVALELFSRKASAVATNVPGPQQPLYMGGSAVSEMIVWVPQTGSVGIGLSIMSYNGRVHFGLVADAKLIPDPDAVTERFGVEFDKLVYLAMMADWDRALDADTAAGLGQNRCATGTLPGE